jgi:hypothetical protein
MSDYWKEFLRVQGDKFILVLLLLVLHFTHAPESIQTMALGGLLTLINAQRFNLNKPVESKKDLP